MEVKYDMWGEGCYNAFFGFFRIECGKTLEWGEDFNLFQHKIFPSEKYFQLKFPEK